MGGFLDNGGYIGTGSVYETNDGVFNLDAVHSAKTSEVYFYDDFETFTGWVTISGGVVSQSSAQAYDGTYSAIKTTNNDPQGAYKLLDQSAVGVKRGWKLTAWIYSVEPRAGGGADRISIVNLSGDGYGLNIQSSSNIIETRSGYSGSSFSTVSHTRTGNVWYRAEFISNLDNTFTLNIYDSSYTLLSTNTSAADTTHTGPFDRVAILGGRDYHVDNLRLTSL